MKRVFVDSDIVLDLLAQRQPYYPFAAQFFSLAEKGKITACISPLIFANLHYILRKQSSKEEAIKNLKKLRVLVTVLPINEKIIDLALASDFRDFEDAIQYYTAVENELEALITRNKRDYKETQIAVWTAEEFLAMWKDEDKEAWAPEGREEHDEDK